MSGTVHDGAEVRHHQRFGRGGIISELCAKEALLRITGLQNDGAGAIAEQHGSIALRPVEIPGQSFRRDQQHTPARAGRNQTVRDTQTVNETAAADVQIHRRRVLDTHAFLHD